jgi:hypothetical protein
MNALVRNCGEAIREVDAVHHAVKVFLSGSSSEWAEVKAAATAKKGERANSESTSGGAAAAVTDAGSDEETEPPVDDSEPPPAVVTSPSADQSTKKSAFGFMSKFTLPTMADLKSMVIS